MAARRRIDFLCISAIYYLLNCSYVTGIELFIGIGSALDRGAKGKLPKSLREFQRNTWLKWIDQSTTSYSFFIHSDKNEATNTIIKSEEKDVVLIPPSFSTHCYTKHGSDHHCRSGAVVHYLFIWSLKNTNADYIINTEHDAFICVHQLYSVLPKFTPITLFANFPGGSIKSDRIEQNSCPSSFDGAMEQSFFLIGRKLATSLINIVNNTSNAKCFQKTQSWCVNTRPILQYLYTIGAGSEIDIIVDQDRVGAFGAMDNWRSLGSPFKNENCPSYTKTNVKSNDELKYNLLVSNACSCGAIYYHLRGDARKGSFGHISKTIVDNTNKWMKTSHYESDLIGDKKPVNLLPKYDPNCAQESCPTAMQFKGTALSDINPVEWWKCPAHLMTPGGEAQLQGEGLKKALEDCPF